MFPNFFSIQDMSLRPSRVYRHLPHHQNIEFLVRHFRQKFEKLVHFIHLIIQSTILNGDQVPSLVEI